MLILLLLYLYSIKSYKPVDERLSQTEEEELIAEWKPEPLVSKEDAEIALRQPPQTIIESFSGSRVKIDGKEYLNFSCNGFLGFQKHPEVIEAAIDCSNKYGVGACGPRGFYGSITPHMSLEKRIAEFMGVPEAVIFSSEFQTIASVIPAFAKPGDVLICDKGASFGIQTGAQLSRANVKWYEHHNIGELKRVLERLTDVFQREKNRVFVVAESISSHHGDLLPLQEILALKKQFPFRIILDESFSIGVLGKTGRGITEHLGIPSTSVEIITASIGNALGSIGGFACGLASMGSHMRLNCSGYVFSCSIPPYLAAAAIKSIDLLESSEEVNILQNNIKNFHKTITSNRSFSNYFTSPSSEFSALVHLRIKKKNKEGTEEEISDGLFKRGIVLPRTKYSKREVFPVEHGLKVSITSEHTQEDINTLINELVEVAKELL
uniref:serine C-palmitoyltransferase n=1 Tax=Arcella intermedia TaxID=1963864 RepID=A0A6B2L4A9_9EUKA